MTFRSRKDSTFITMIAVIVLIMFSSLILPLILESERTTSDVITKVSIFTVSLAFILWFVFSMKYTFLDQHLRVRSAFISKRIPYQDITIITHINSTADMLSGFQLLTAKKGLEISYRTGMIGSVKISPKEEDLFLSEMKKHCATVEVKRVPGT